MKLFQSRYSRVCYETNKKYLSDSYRKSNQAKWRYRLNWFVSIASIVTNCLLVYMMASEYKFELWRYHAYSYYFYKNRDLYDPYLHVVITLFVVMNLYIQISIHKMPTNNRLWRWNYEMFVTQQDWYAQCLITNEKQLKLLHKQRFTEITKKLNLMKYAIPEMLIV